MYIRSVDLASAERKEFVGISKPRNINLIWAWSDVIEPGPITAGYRQLPRSAVFAADADSDADGY